MLNINKILLFKIITIIVVLTLSVYALLGMLIFSLRTVTAKDLSFVWFLILHIFHILAYYSWYLAIKSLIFWIGSQQSTYVHARKSLLFGLFTIIGGNHFLYLHESLNYLNTLAFIGICLLFSSPICLLMAYLSFKKS